MAQNAATFDSYDQIGLKEDVDDLIYNIDPVDTPFASGVKRGKAKNTLFEWQTDTLRAAAANAQVEADDVTYVTSVPTVRLSNRTQILAKNVVVSETSQAVEAYGRDDELEYQLAKCAAELKRDIEFMAVRNAKLDAGSSSTARTSAGLESWIATNVRKAGSNTTGTTVGYSGGAVSAPIDGTTMSTFIESDLRALMNTIWTAGGEPNMLMVNGANKSLFSRTFTGIASLQRQVGAKNSASVLGAADVYQSDFGDLTVIPNRHVRGRVAFLLDMKRWRLDVLRPTKVSVMAKTGDAEKRFMVTELGLAALNEKASGKIVDILDSY